MAKKVTAEEKLNYQKEIKDVKAQIADIEGKVKKLEQQMKEDQYGLENYFHIAIASEYLNRVNLSCDMSKISEAYMKKKNDDFLNDARKAYFKSLIEFEKFLGNFVDEALNEKQEVLETILQMNPMRVLRMVNKLKNMLEMIERGYGENSKYKWSFVDMQGRYITIFKNLLNYRTLSVNDPRHPYFAENTQLLNMIKLMLQQVSTRFREKYMIGTKEVVDIKQAINFQEALRKINSLLGAQEEAESNKRTVESWKQMLEKEEKMKKDKAKREARAKKKK